MRTHTDKPQQRSSKAVTNSVAQKKSAAESAFQFVDNRPESMTQSKRQAMVDASPQVTQLKSFQEMANNSVHDEQAIQLMEKTEHYSAQHQLPIQKKENKTGLPDSLKTGVENLSGYSMDDVKVRYNSDKPAQLQAHAYAQGANIHLGPGQERHLPHEAWHVVQQKQGRVRPTMQMKGVGVNVDGGLEKEADVMGQKAVNGESMVGHKEGPDYTSRASEKGSFNACIQCKPDDIENHQNTLTMDGTGGGAPQLVNAAANRANVSVAYPFNAMAELGMVKSSDAPLTGGHLFKAEYGGIDDITNVVPWNDASERAYTTFENAYLRNCTTRARQNGGQQASVDVVASVTFKTVSSVRKSISNLLRNRGGTSNKRRTIASLIQYSIESVPTSVDAYAEVGGIKVPNMGFNSDKLVDKKDIDEGKIRQLYDQVKDGDWAGKPQRAIEKLSEWEDIEE